MKSIVRIHIAKYARLLVEIQERITVAHEDELSATRGALEMYGIAAPEPSPHGSFTFEVFA